MSNPHSFSTNTLPTSYQFSVMWNNNALFNRHMSKHHVTLRNAGGHNNVGGITAKHLHLDQVHIIFKPTGQITTFAPGDSANNNWRVETSQLMVRTTPGEKHVLYNSNTDMHDAASVVRDPAVALVYSSALALVPDLDGPEDYWCRSYKPIRDLPIGNYFHNITDLSIELIFPLLFADPTQAFTTVPDYRILKVLCEFSVNQ